MSWLPFGVLRRAHGTGGEILLARWNRENSSSVKLAPGMSVRLSRDGRERDLVIASCRPVHDGFLVVFEGMPTREAASELTGAEVHISRAGLAPLGEREFFVEDLVGCEAFGSDGQALGRVRGTFWNGAQDVMILVAMDGSESYLPVVAEHIVSVAIAERRVVVDLHE